MIYLHLNCDEYLSGQRILDLKRALGDAEMADLNTSTLRGEQLTAADLLGEASMMPFLTPKRLLLVYGFWDSLEKRMAASKGTDSAAHRMAAQLLTGLAEVPDTCDLLFVEGTIDKRRLLWKGFTLPAKEGRDEQKIPGLDELIKRKIINQEELATPDAKALAGWLHRYARSQNIAIEGNATQTLAEFVGPNLRLLHNELHKLATYASGRAVTGEDVKLLVSDASEALIWDLTDALSQRNGRRAIHTLYELRRGDANAFYLLTMIARQYRIMLKVKSAMQQTRGNEYDIAKVVGEKPYSVKKAMSLANSYSVPDLIDIMERLLETDYAMKSGANAETEIDLLIATLTQKRRERVN